MPTFHFQIFYFQMGIILRNGKAWFDEYQKLQALNTIVFKYNASQNTA